MAAQSELNSREETKNTELAMLFICIIQFKKLFSFCNSCSEFLAFNRISLKFYPKPHNLFVVKSTGTQISGVTISTKKNCTEKRTLLWGIFCLTLVVELNNV